MAVGWMPTTSSEDRRVARTRWTTWCPSIACAIMRYMTIPRKQVGVDSLGRPIWLTDPYLRVMAQTERRNDCLVFTGCVNRTGYGRVSVGRNRQALAHRIVWRHHNPDAPEPEAVLHTCDNPPCVELDHLRAGTRAENSADMVAKGRSPKAQGEASGRARLTSKDVAAIRAERAAGATLTSLADRYGVHHAYLSRLLRGLRRQYD